MVGIRIVLVEMEIFFLDFLDPWVLFFYFSTGSGAAVADTSRRVDGALAKKSALKSRLNDAIKQLQATERGKDHRELKPPLFTGIKINF